MGVGFKRLSHSRSFLYDFLVKNEFLMHVQTTDPSQTAAIKERTLFFAPLCPFSRKIRLGLLEKKLTWQALEERPYAGSEKLYQVNAEGSVPVLVDEGKAIIKSYAIQEYLEEAYPEEGLLGQSLTERAEVRRLLTWFDEKLFQSVTQRVLYEKVVKRGLGRGEPDSMVLKKARRALYDHMDYISWLFDRHNWLAGRFLSWADLAAAAQLSCVDYLGDVPWEKYKSAKAWYMRLKSRPSFRPLLMESFAGLVPSRHYRMLDF